MSQLTLTTAPTTVSQPGESLLPESTDLFTAGSFALIAVLAVLVVLGLIYGARLRRRRREAAEELTHHNETLRTEGVTPAPAAPTGEPLATPATTAPVPAKRDIGVEAAPQATQAADRRDPMLEPDTPAADASLDDEPIAAAAPTLAENLATETAPVAPAAPTGPSPADGPVTQLKGLGPRVAERLAEHGITTVGQLAALTDDEAQALDTRLGPFTGRMTRDRWLEQARFLAAGDVRGFEAVFGKL